VSGRVGASQKLTGSRFQVQMAHSLLHRAHEAGTCDDGCVCQHLPLEMATLGTLRIHCLRNIS
jgi:hypothetical protein